MRCETILVVAAENFELKYIRPQSSAEWILRPMGRGRRWRARRLIVWGRASTR